MTAEPPESALHPGDPDWHWDGERWQYAGVAPGDGGTPGEQLDDTGQWVWDGTTWQPLT